MYVSPREKGNTSLFGGLGYGKIWRYNNSPLYVTTKWLPPQIPPLNFLGQRLAVIFKNNLKCSIHDSKIYLFHFI